MDKLYMYYYHAEKNNIGAFRVPVNKIEGGYATRNGILIKDEELGVAVDGYVKYVSDGDKDFTEEAKSVLIDYHVAEIKKEDLPQSVKWAHLRDLVSCCYEEVDKEKVGEERQILAKELVKKYELPKKSLLFRRGYI